MATATTTRNLGKTGFVKEFLNDNPQANAQAVNDAWKAAGFEGTISHSLVTQVRSQLGLTGNLPKPPEKKARAETGHSTARQAAEVRMAAACDPPEHGMARVEVEPVPRLLREQATRRRGGARQQEAGEAIGERRFSHAPGARQQPGMRETA